MSDLCPVRPLPAGLLGSEQLLDQFDEAHRKGIPVRIEDYLKAFGEGTPDAGGRRAFLEELVKIDLECSWRRAAERAGADTTGIGSRLEDYLQRYAELGPVDQLPVELIGWEYRARRLWGDHPGHAEYLMRFAAQASSLRTVLPDLDAEMAAERSATASLALQHRPVAEQPPNGATRDPLPLSAQVPSSIPAMLAALRAWPLLDAKQLNDVILEDLQGRFANPAALARELVRRGWLTPFQVNQLMRGRGAELVRGPYVVLERLGQGGVGQVFKARHLHMQRLVALKVIRPDNLGDPEVVGRFYREIRLASQLAHPNVVHAYDAGPLGGVPVLVMEYIEGADLASLVRQRGPLPVAQAADYIAQAALGVQHAHERGLVHRDIKPPNLIVTGFEPVGGGAAPPGPRGLVKVLDLGLARLRGAVAGDQTNLLTPAGGVLVGTLDYLAPEQALDFHGADGRADIYGLGCTLFFLLTGQPPFPKGSLAEKLLKHQQAEPPPLTQWRADVPAGLAAALRRMLAKRPEDRFQSAAEVAAVLQPFARSGDPVHVALPVAVPLAQPIRDGSAMAAALPGACVPAPATDLATVRVEKSGGHRRGQRRWLLVASVGMAAVLAGLGGLAHWHAAREIDPRSADRQPGTQAVSPASPDQVRFVSVEGIAHVRSDGPKSPARVGLVLPPGKGLETEANGEAVLAWPDGTRLQVGPESVISRMNWGALAGKQVDVDLGGLKGSVVPQPDDRPVVLRLPQADAVVTIPRGRFAVRASRDRACLRVDEGTAWVKRMNDGQKMALAAGEYILIAARGDLVPRSLAAGVRVLQDSDKRFAYWGAINSDLNNSCELVSPGRFGKYALRVNYVGGLAPGGVIHNFGALGQIEDWSKYGALYFWLRGSNRRSKIVVTIWSRNGSFVHALTDDWDGWRPFSLPWSAFEMADRTLPKKEFDLTQVTCLQFCVLHDSKGSFQLDQIELRAHELLPDP